MNGPLTARAPNGQRGVGVQTFSQGLSVKGNQMASARPLFCRKLSKVLPPLPAAANISLAGMFT